MTEDPQLTQSSNGKDMCKFSLAVKRKYTKENQADFISFIAFGSIAKYIAGYAKKGMLVGVGGSLQTFIKNGKEKAELPEKGFNIAVEDFEILSTKEEMKRYNNRDEMNNAPFQQRGAKVQEDNGDNPFDMDLDIPF